MYNVPVGSYSSVLRAASAYAALPGRLRCRRCGRGCVLRTVVTVRQPLWLLWIVVHLIRL